MFNKQSALWYLGNNRMREYKGFKYGLSKYGNEIHYYTEKTIKQGKPQIKLKAATVAEAEKEIHKIIDNILNK